MSQAQELQRLMEAMEAIQKKEVVSISEKKWMAKCALYKDFCSKFGIDAANTTIDTSDHPKLGNWIHTQRKQRKAGKLSQHRIEQLESAGFVWQKRSSSKAKKKVCSAKFVDCDLMRMMEMFKGSAAGNMLEKLCAEREILREQVKELEKRPEPFTYKQIIDEGNTKGKMTTQRFSLLMEKAGFPTKSDQHVCHIISKANGGADHPLNYCVCSGKVNMHNKNYNDPYYACVVGIERTQEAIAVSMKFGSYTDSQPSAEELFEIGQFAVKQGRSIAKRDMARWKKTPDSSTSSDSE